MITSDQFKIQFLKNQITTVSVRVGESAPSRRIVETKVSQFAFTAQKPFTQLSEAVAITKYTIQKADQVFANW